MMAMLEKPKILKIVSLGITGLMMVVLSISLTIMSAPEFASFYDGTQKWYDCNKYSFAKTALFGDASYWLRVTVTSAHRFQKQDRLLRSCHCL